MLRAPAKLRPMTNRLPLLLALALLNTAPQAAEGMWPLNHLPTAALQQAGLKPDIELLRQASVQLPYGSGSFVSAEGLVLTNHHVISECIDALSSAREPLQQRGFVAATRAQERRCPGMEIQQLQGIDALDDLPADAAARRARIGQLEGADCPAGQRCRVVALHGGALMQRYRTKVWNDVRLAMAPEAQAANFGGDDDNFNYQRFAFDFALLRVYDEHGRPLRTPLHLRPATQALRDGDALMVPGHPYRTARSLTVAQLEAERDALLPARLAALDAELALLRAYAARGAEAARQVADLQASLENSRKSRFGALEALLKPGLLKTKQAREAELRAAGDAPWAAAARSAQAAARLAVEQHAIALPMNSQISLLVDALTLRAERRLPEAERLADFQGAAEAGLLAQLGGDSPFHAELEALRLRGHADRARAQLGQAHPWVQTVERAGAASASARWARGTERLALLTRSDAELAALTGPDGDALLRLAQALMPLRRDFERRWSAEVEQPLHGASEAIAQASFRRFGSTQAPDATFTLRLSFGRAQGVTSGGYRHPWQTTFGGLYARADAFEHKPPFDLAPRLAAARERLPLRAPLNFIGTPDIVGGNSGSPVLNARHEWVGLAFDGNLDSLAGDYVYDEASNRMVALHQQGIRLALTRIYPAAKLTREMGL